MLDSWIRQLHVSGESAVFPLEHHMDAKTMPAKPTEYPMESNLPGKKKCIHVSFNRRPEFGSYESRQPTGWLSWLSCAGGRGFKNPGRTNTQGF